MGDLVFLSQRITPIGHTTPGRVWLQETLPAVPICYSLEDLIREPAAGRPVDAGLLAEWVATWKQPNATAIPAGRYRILITDSVRFKRPMLQLMDVPGFAGIRIHGGNTEADTEGCPLVGLHSEPGRLWQCAPAVDAIFGFVSTALHAGRTCWWDVRNPAA